MDILSRLEKASKDRALSMSAGERGWPELCGDAAKEIRRWIKLREPVPRTSWLEVAASRIRAGEPEVEVMKDYGYRMAEQGCDGCRHNLSGQCRYSAGCIRQAVDLYEDDGR